MVRELNIALAGLGTVGGACARLLEERAEFYEKRSRGVRLRLVAASARDPDKKRDFLPRCPIHSDPLQMLEKSDADIVVELIGGAGEPALSLARATLEQGKSFCTANKALLARHGAELAALAEKHNAKLRFEAAVAGAVPVISALHPSLSANRIERIGGILNGTCNYILSEMAVTGRDFDAILTEAQRKGYAEADPSDDIDGFDTGHKLALLAARGFGIRPCPEQVFIEGIRHISLADLQLARDLSMVCKLLGLAVKLGGDRIAQYVYPALLPSSSPLASVRGALNQIVVDTDCAGRLRFEGAGAGGAETASAVIGDLIALALDHETLAFGVASEMLRDTESVPISERRGGYCLRTESESFSEKLQHCFRDNNLDVETHSSYAFKIPDADEKTVQRILSENGAVNRALQTKDTSPESTVESAVSVLRMEDGF